MSRSKIRSSRPLSAPAPVNRTLSPSLRPRRAASAADIVTARRWRPLGYARGEHRKLLGAEHAMARNQEQTVSPGERCRRLPKYAPARNGRRGRPVPEAAAVVGAADIDGSISRTPGSPPRSGPPTSIWNLFSAWSEFHPGAQNRGMSPRRRLLLPAFHSPGQRRVLVLRRRGLSQVDVGGGRGPATLPMGLSGDPLPHHSEVCSGSRLSDAPQRGGSEPQWRPGHRPGSPKSGAPADESSPIQRHESRTDSRAASRQRTAGRVLRWRRRFRRIPRR